MDTSKLTMAQQFAQAASAFQEQRTGHAPKLVTVVLSEGTLVITLHRGLARYLDDLTKLVAVVNFFQDRKCLSPVPRRDSPRTARYFNFQTTVV
ncbi:MAG: hypothetical protein WC975_04375 [Phycisphaerae bacterium]